MSGPGTREETLAWDARGRGGRGRRTGWGTPLLRYLCSIIAHYLGPLLQMENHLDNQFCFRPIQPIRRPPACQPMWTTVSLRARETIREGVSPHITSQSRLMLFGILETSAGFGLIGTLTSPHPKP